MIPSCLYKSFWPTKSSPETHHLRDLKQGKSPATSDSRNFLSRLATCIFIKSPSEDLEIYQHLDAVFKERTMIFNKAGPLAEVARLETQIDELNGELSATDSPEVKKRLISLIETVAKQLHKIRPTH